MLALRELKNFLAVADRLNISSAAHAVNLSQPALSRQIQGLERKLGVALFERVGKRLVLTAEGADLAVQAAELIDHAEDLFARTTQNEPEFSGTLRLGASPQSITGLLLPAMTRFRKTHPKVELIVSEGDNDALIEMVENGAVHMVIANLGISNILAGTPLFRSQLLAVLHGSHRLAMCRSVSMAAIADEPLMVMRRGFLTRHLFEQVAAAHGLRPRIVLESGSTQTLAALAREGHGVAIVSSSAWDIAHLSCVVPICSDICQTSADVSALCNPRRYCPASLSHFISVLTAVAADRPTATPPVPSLARSDSDPGG